jgi:hypothetical protein
MHRASKIIDTFATYHGTVPLEHHGSTGGCLMWLSTSEGRLVVFVDTRHLRKVRLDASQDLLGNPKRKV